MDSDSLPEKYIFKDEIITVQYPDEIHDSEAFERRTMFFQRPFDIMTSH